MIVQCKPLIKDCLPFFTLRDYWGIADPLIADFFIGQIADAVFSSG
jgi:hypothetical protein